MIKREYLAILGATLICIQWITNSIYAQSGIENMIFVEGGTFVMGSTPWEIDSLSSLYGFPASYLQSESPPHVVTLSSFYMDKYEVTHEDFRKFLIQQPQWNKLQIPPELHNGSYLAHWINDEFPMGMEKYPVYNINWYAAVAYCQWIGGRLPTEAEWEFVAGNRGQDQIYPWGNSQPDSTRANYLNKIGKATRVGSYPPNDLGFYDLAGNVWEYVVDEWSGDYYAESPVNNPVNGPKIYQETKLKTVKSRRVIRGGSWGGADINLRVHFRDSHPATGAGDHVGCRCGRDSE